jgi:hypothetical protein
MNQLELHRTINLTAPQETWREPEEDVYEEQQEWGVQQEVEDQERPDVIPRTRSEKRTRRARKRAAKDEEASKRSKRQSRKKSNRHQEENRPAQDTIMEDEDETSQHEVTT